MYKLKLEVKVPLLLEETLFSGQLFRWNTVGNGYCGYIKNRLVMVTLLDNVMEIDSALPVSSGEVIEYFSLDDDLHKLHNILKNDPQLLPVVNRYFGLRIVRQDPFECTVSFIASIASNIKKIGYTLDNLSKLAGETSQVGTCQGYLFPSQEKFLTLDRSDFLKSGFGFRSRYLISLQKHLGKEPLFFERIASLPYEEKRKELMHIDGIGEKVADCILLFSYSQTNAFPVDRWIERAMIKLYFNGEKTKKKEIREYAIERWGGMAGYIQQYIFHGIRNRMI